jgi:multidrug efflux system membrane fusion protein
VIKATNHDTQPSAPDFFMKNSRSLILATAIAAIAGGGYWYSNTPKTPTSPTAKTAAPVPVTVATAETGEMPILLNTVGRAEAYEGVTLKSRIDGQVLAVAYTEGQQVKQGDVLVRLDPADFNARAMQAEAVLARDQAQLAKTQADIERYVALKARGFVSEEKVNEVRTAAAAAAASVQAAKAGLELARLQLSYTTIRAPFSGMVGARLVFPGSAVKINDTALAVVNRVSPLYVTFSIPEKQLPRLRAAMQRGPMKVQVRLPGNKEQALEGVAKFIDNAVDATTGTILMKAVLDNKDGKLTPGQFLNVGMTLDKLSDTLLIPNEAVQQGAEGNFLYVVKPDNSVEVRKIEVISTHQGRSAIGQGINAGDIVVTDGQLRLTPGAQVKVKQGQAAATPATPAASQPAAAAPR